jgi:succinyl-diaminopimelate desuccinylase
VSSIDPVALTRALIQQKTVTGLCDKDFVKWLGETLRRVGFSVSTVESGRSVHIAATIGPIRSRLKLGFLGHYDTVPEGEGWRYAPFEGAEVEGIMYGRGASDMKSGDAAMISAAAELAAQGLHITVLLPGDEETLSEGMPALLDSLPYSLDFCIGGEPTSKNELGDCLKIGRRGVLQGKIRLLGKAGHAAYADKNKNIIDALPLVLDTLGRRWNDQCHGVETTLAITNLSTDSTAINVIPGTVTLSFDARFSPQRTADEIEGEINHRLQSTSTPYELVISKRTNPYLNDNSPSGDPKQRALVESAREAIREVTGREPVLSCDGGTSDARFTAQRGIPTVEFGVPHGNMHGPDEFVAVQDVLLLQQVYVKIAERLARALQK